MNSAIGKLYPTTKFFVLLALVIVCIFHPGWLLQYLMLPVVLVISLLAGTARQFLGTFFKATPHKGEKCDIIKTWISR